VTRLGPDGVASGATSAGTAAQRAKQLAGRPADAHVGKVVHVWVYLPNRPVYGGVT